MTDYQPLLDGLRKELHDLDADLHTLGRPRSPAEANRVCRNAEVIIESMTATLRGVGEDLKAGDGS